jgi:hypothetical protein
MEATATLQQHRAKSDHAFLATRNLVLPTVINSALKVCNGLDVVKRTVFDHMHGWMQGRDFSLGAAGNQSGVPSVVGASLFNGGHPEDLSAAQALDRTRLFLNNLHYQGGAKSRISVDICSHLLREGSPPIRDISVKTHCAVSIR